LKRTYPQIAQILFLAVSLFATSLAQSPAPKKRKKIKDFGSSLKRLKWDPQKNAATQIPSTEDVANSEDDVIRIDTSLVSCELLVLDRQGNSVSGLTAADFSITEDNTPQTVGHFFNGDNVDVPRTIVLIIDYSGSQLPYLRNSINAAKVLVDKLGPKDLMAIVTDDVEMIQEFTADKKKLKNKLDHLVKGAQIDDPFNGFDPPRLGRSKQYSALMATLKEVFDEEDVRPIIIFQTDGDEAYFLRNPVIRMTLPEGLQGDELQFAKGMVAYYEEQLVTAKTEFSLDDLYHAVERSRATVYTVVPGIKLLGLPFESQVAKVMDERRRQFAELVKKSAPQMQDRMKNMRAKRNQNIEMVSVVWQAQRTEKLQSALAGVAGLTGGWTEFLESPEQADEIYSRIFSDINQRYIVGYYPTNKERDGKRRKIDFQVKGHPEYQVYGRRFYFSPTP